MNDSIERVSGQNWSTSISESIILKKTETLTGSENTVDLFEKCEKNDILMRNISSLRNLSILNGFQYQSKAIPQINSKTTGPSDTVKMADYERQRNNRLNSDASKACRCKDFATAYNSALAITDDNLRNALLSEISFYARRANDYKSACDAAKSLTDEEARNARLSEISFSARFNKDYRSACDVAKLLTDEKVRNTRLSEISFSARSANDYESACDAAKSLTDEEVRNTRLSEISFSARCNYDFNSAFIAADAITDMKSKKIRLNEVAYSAERSGNRAVADSAKKSLANLDRRTSAADEVLEMVENLNGSPSESLIFIQDDMVNIGGVALKRK